MSSAVVSTSAALGRPFLFNAESEADERPVSSAKKPASAESEVARLVPSSIRSTIPLVTPASRLEMHPAPEMVTSGISALDALAGGLPRGCLTEICGPVSSGRTSVMLAALAAATRRGEYCALIDASDALDPQSVAAAGIDLDRLLWVRCGEESLRKENSPQRYRGIEKNRNQVEEGCPELVEWGGIFSQAKFDFDHRENRNIPRASQHRLEQVLRSTDLLLESGGFGLIVLDLTDIPPQTARRIPLTTWFRFRRAVENKPTILLAIEQQPIAGSCSSLLLQLGPSKEEMVPANESAAERQKNADHGASRGLSHFPPAHAHLLTGLEMNAELIRSRLDRKPARSVIFKTKPAWAG